jgi:small conductance mechanosensitive channel
MEWVVGTTNHPKVLGLTPQRRRLLSVKFSFLDQGFSKHSKKSLFYHLCRPEKPYFFFFKKQNPLRVTPSGSLTNTATVQQDYVAYALELTRTYGPNLLISLAILVVGLWLIRRISRAFGMFLKARQVDESLRPFLGSMIDVAMKVALILVVAGRLGLETTSFIAVFSAIAFAVGLALQGSLGNFASGVLILLFRPYKVGDWLTVEANMGEVREIQIFNTILVTPEGKRIIIPNGKMTEGAIESIAPEGEVRAQVEVHVRDKTSIPTLRDAAQAAIRHCPHRLPDREGFVEIAGFPMDSMKVIVGCWTTGTHYWDTFYFLHERLKYEFDLVGIKLAKFDDPT